MSKSRKHRRPPARAATKKQVVRADRAPKESADRGRSLEPAKPRTAGIEAKPVVKLAPGAWSKQTASATTRVVASQRKGRRSRLAPALALSSAFGLMALGLLQPVSEHIRSRSSEASPKQRVEANTDAPARLADLAPESDATPAQHTLASLQRMTALTATPRQEAVLVLPAAPARTFTELPRLPAVAELSPPPTFEAPAGRLSTAIPAELVATAILVPEAGRLVAKMHAKKAPPAPSDAANEPAPLASAAVDVEWLLAFATPDETVIDPTVPSIPMLLPEPPAEWQLGAIATIEASIPSRKRVSFVDFAMRPVPAETGERYVPEAAARSEGYAVHPPLPTMELPDSQRLREIILAHETARKARLAAAAKAKQLAAERAAMNSIDGKSIGCLPAAIKQVLFDITRLFGPVHVNSSYRSPSHNRNVGGASRSLHMECRAVDFRVAGNHQRVMKYIVNRNEVGGYKNYGGHIHIDNGPRRSW